MLVGVGTIVSGADGSVHGLFWVGLACPGLCWGELCWSEQVWSGPIGLLLVRIGVTCAGKYRVGLVRTGTIDLDCSGSDWSCVAWFGLICTGGGSGAPLSA